jgi:hypothetical protein
MTRITAAWITAFGMATAVWSAPPRAAWSFTEGLSTSTSVDGATARIQIQPHGPVPISAVRGAPWSGRVVSGTQQTMVWRDSRGRVRTERTVFPEPFTFVLAEIQDPSAKRYYVFDPARKVAHRMKAKAASSEWPARIRWNEFAAFPTLSLSWTEVSDEPLGSKTMFGVMVKGIGQTYRRPVGDRTATMTTESWWSPQLDLVVSSTSTSTDGSATGTRVEGLSTAEPAPSLFRVPAGYRIIDETGAFTVSATL